MPSPRTERFTNGLTTVIIPVPGSHQVLISLALGVGSRFEHSEQAGISHLVEHMLFRGNTAFPDSAALFRAFEQTGEILNGTTGIEITEYYQTAHPALVEESLSYLAQFIRHPTFPDFEKERRIVLDELVYDYNDQGQLIRLDSLAAGQLWAGTPLAHGAAGTPETVSRITVANVIDHYRRHYHPANMVLAMAGRLDEEAAISAARRCLGEWDHAPAEGVPLCPGSTPSPHEGPATQLVHDPDNQFRLQMSFPATGYRHPDEIPLAMLGGILDDGPNSRLQQIVREQQALVYDIAAGYTSYWDAGQMDINTAVTPERLGSLLNSVLAILHRLCESGVEPEELEAAKRRYRFALEFGRDSLDAHLNRHGWPVLFDAVRDEPEERRIMEAVTTEQLNTLAGRIFTRERLNLVVVGPVDDRAAAIVQESIDRF